MRFLVIKVGAIGDILQTTPFIKLLKENLNCNITYLTLPYSQEVVINNPYISKILTLDLFRARGCIGEALSLVVKYIRKFDVVINLNRSYLSYILSFLLGRRRIGFKKEFWEYLLNEAVYFDYTKHEVYRYQELLNIYSIKERSEKLYIFLSPEDIDFAQSFFKENKLLKKDNRLIIAVHPGGGINPGTILPSKRWPLDYYINLIDSLLKELDARVIILGSEDEKDISFAIQNKIRNKDLVLATGLTKGIKKLAAVIRQCDVFIGNDSGPLYLAAAVDVATFGIYGPSEPYIVAPLGKKHAFIKYDLPCSPCYHPKNVHKKGYFLCKDVVCMKRLVPELVFNRIKIWLEELAIL